MKSIFAHEYVTNVRRFIMDQSYLSEDYISLYYSKTTQLKLLKLEVANMRTNIISKLQMQTRSSCRVGGYSIHLKPFHKVSAGFIQIMHDNNYSHLINESCKMADFNAIVSKLNITNKREYLYVYSNSLFISYKEPTSQLCTGVQFYPIGPT